MQRDREPIIFDQANIIVLEEDENEDFQPSEQEILEYANWLNMDVQNEKHLLWIAKDGLKAPCPEDWRPCKFKNSEDIFYHNFATGQSSYDHPLDNHFRQLYLNEKQKSKKQLQTNLTPNTSAISSLRTSMQLSEKQNQKPKKKYQIQHSQISSTKINNSQQAGLTQNVTPTSTQRLSKQASLRQVQQPLLQQHQQYQQPDIPKSLILTQRLEPLQTKTIEPNDIKNLSSTVLHSSNYNKSDRYKQNSVVTINQDQATLQHNQESLNGALNNQISQDHTLKKSFTKITAEQSKRFSEASILADSNKPQANMLNQNSSVKLKSYELQLQGDTEVEKRALQGKYNQQKKDFINSIEKSIEDIKQKYKDNRKLLQIQLEKELQNQRLENQSKLEEAQQKFKKLLLEQECQHQLQIEKIKQGYELEQVQKMQESEQKLQEQIKSSNVLEQIDKQQQDLQQLNDSTMRKKQEILHQQQIIKQQQNEIDQLNTQKIQVNNQIKDSQKQQIRSQTDIQGNQQFMVPQVIQQEKSNKCLKDSQAQNHNVNTVQLEQSNLYSQQEYLKLQIQSKLQFDRDQSTNEMKMYFENRIQGLDMVVQDIELQMNYLLENDLRQSGVSNNEENVGNILGNSSNFNKQLNKGRVSTGKKVEDIYKKVTQREHVLLRPDTYIGSIDKDADNLWVHDGSSLLYKEVQLSKGLYKIFDEILVNAADNFVRDPNMDTIKVTIDQEQNLISVWNNGKGIPIQIHKTEGIYVPELIFGHLLTSSNYNDDEKKITGGRNGFGAKLANIWSTEFTIETADPKLKKYYKQTFKNNMAVKGEPKIKDLSKEQSFTCVSFKPDLTRFKMVRLEDDMFELMRKRVYDLAGCLDTKVKVYLNGQRIPVKNFKEYCEMYLDKEQEDEKKKMVYETVNDRWQICIAPNESNSFKQVSFVNSICTWRGGTHVKYIADQVANHLLNSLKKNKEFKDTRMSKQQIMMYMWVFVNCHIENPSFDSQTKETLNLPEKKFGSKCELSDKFLKSVEKCGILELIQQHAQQMQTKDMSKKDGSKKNDVKDIAKLEDAINAGKKGCEECTLILTEGDSAKALAMSGIGVVGKANFGVFPLRGKLLNVREASGKQILENKEISNIKKILGLQVNKQYTDVKELRYGHLMIMTDQDHDGSHIKGLLLNFIHYQFPGLLKVPGFMLEFITPILKATKKSNNKDVRTFYTIPQFEEWLKNDNINTKLWSIKYYKGLGTSTQKEAQQYFANIRNNRKRFIWNGPEDGKHIEMAFSKQHADQRKTWLQSYQPGTYIDHTLENIPYTDFINKELILFSRADLERSIPALMDGLKPGQRKIMFSCFKRNLKTDVKVAQLSGYVAEHSAYHHGEVSLQSSIVNLAQNFVGSNNINLLVPQGQFGTRMQGGKDAASTRYIYTRFESLTRLLFNEADDKLLNYLNEEGQSIEPEQYYPILPTVLVNGAEGIGTGWSTYIPNYNPRDIVENIRRRIHDEEMQPIHPWFRGFNGTIQQISSSSYIIHGKLTRKDDRSYEVIELPVRKWTDNYRDFLESMRKNEDKKKVYLQNYESNCTDEIVFFEIQVMENKAAEVSSVGPYNFFKLSTKLSTGNMMLFDANGKIKRYDNPLQIIEEFYVQRLVMYENRKAYLLQACEFELKKLSNKVRFVLMVVDNKLKIYKRKRKEIEADLDKLGFDRLENLKSKAPAQQQEEIDQEITDENQDAQISKANYDYLLTMAIYSLTYEKVESLQNEEHEITKKKDLIVKTSPKQMWLNDLDDFMKGYETFENEKENEAQELYKQQVNAQGDQKHIKKNKKKNTNFDSDSDIDMGSDDDDYFKPKKAKKAKGKKDKQSVKAFNPVGELIEPPEYVEQPEKVKKQTKGKNGNLDDNLGMVNGNDDFSNDDVMEVDQSQGLQLAASQTVANKPKQAQPKKVKETKIDKPKQQKVEKAEKGKAKKKANKYLNSEDDDDDFSDEDNDFSMSEDEEDDVFVDNDKENDNEASQKIIQKQSIKTTTIGNNENKTKPAKATTVTTKTTTLATAPLKEDKPKRQAANDAQNKTKKDLFDIVELTSDEDEQDDQPIETRLPKTKPQPQLELSIQPQITESKKPKEKQQSIANLLGKKQLKPSKDEGAAKKVQKIRDSPFHKKSGKAGGSKSRKLDLEDSEFENDDENVQEKQVGKENKVTKPPRRAQAKKATYKLDSDSDLGQNESDNEFSLDDDDFDD